MSLSGALSIAQSALANSAAQSALLSQNIANVGNSNYSRKSAQAISLLTGGVQTGTTTRAAAAALLGNLLAAQSTSAASTSKNDALTQIASSLGLDNKDNSPATLISTLSNALRQYAASPDNDTLGTSVVTAAKSLTTGLNTASAGVQSARTQADTAIAASVKTINDLLAQFKVANDQVVVGTKGGSDVSTAQDTRDGILKQLSSEIGITTAQGAGGSLSIYTDSGVTLFETSPRTISFTPTNTFVPGTVGQAVSVDGVPITGSSAVMPIVSGRLAGLTAFRDGTSVAYQNQLDQIASTLISSFSESDQTGGSAPTRPGLFTISGLTAMPTDVTGLAAQISINANADSSKGGVVTRLRDGNIADPTNTAYTYNTTGASAYSDRLAALGTALAQTRSFDASTGGVASGSLATYAASSVSWLEAQRQSSAKDVSYNSAAVATTTAALSNATGVNLDDQMSQMLDIEHAYKATAQLMNTVNLMYADLLKAFG